MTDPNKVPMPDHCIALMRQVLPDWNLAEMWVAVDACRMGAPSYAQVKAVVADPAMVHPMKVRAAAIEAAKPTPRIIDGEAEETQAKIDRLNFRLSEETQPAVRAALVQAISVAEGKLSALIEEQIKEAERERTRLRR